MNEDKEKVSRKVFIFYPWLPVGVPTFKVSGRLSIVTWPWSLDISITSFADRFLIIIYMSIFVPIICFFFLKNNLIGSLESILVKFLKYRHYFFKNEFYVGEKRPVNGRPNIYYEPYVR